MLEIIQNLEDYAGSLKTIVLVGAGLGAIIAGLVIWLAGLGIRKALVAIAAAGIGAAGAFLMAEPQLKYVFLAAGIGLITGLVLEKIMSVIIPALLAAVSTFVTIAQLNDAEWFPDIRLMCSQVPTHSWAFIGGAAIVCLAVGFCLRRLVWALCCAAFGSLAIFAGMIMILKFKGTSATEMIAAKPYVYAGALTAMCIFGTIVQLLLFKKKRKSTQDESQSEDKEEQPQKKKRNWRTS